MKPGHTFALVVVAVLSLTAVAIGQPTVGPLCCKTVQDVTAQPIGFDGEGRAVFEITVLLAAHDPCAENDQLLVRIRDNAAPPPFSPTAPESSWWYRGRSSQPVTIKLKLPVPHYFRGPVSVDVLMVNPERYAAIMGPMMLPKCQCGLQPYGCVDLARNRLHLRATYAILTQSPPPIKLVVEGAPPGAQAIFAVSPFRTELSFPMGGRLLIGPAMMIPIGVTNAGPKGRFRLTVKVPAAVWHARIPVFVQAVCDSFDDSLEPWFFSNGVVLQRDG